MVDGTGREDTCNAFVPSSLAFRREVLVVLCFRIRGHAHLVLQIFNVNLSGPFAHEQELFGSASVGVAACASLLCEKLNLVFFR
jgi:hypothetical protein